MGTVQSQTLSDLILQGQLDLAFHLVKTGTESYDRVGQSGISPYHAAVLVGDSIIFHMLVKADAPLIPHLPEEQNELHVAGSRGYYKIAQIILRDPIKFPGYKHASDRAGRTPLHLAAQCGNAALVALLLKYNSDPSLRDKSGRRPVDLATQTNQSEEVIDQFSVPDFLSKVQTPRTKVASQNSVESEETEVTPHVYITSYMQKHSVNIPIIRQHEIVFEEQVSRGSSCVVYRGKWRGSEIGIKQFNPEYKTTKREMDNFLTELKTLASIRHPNLLLLMGVCLDSSNLWIITEFVDNHTLFYALHRNKERKLSLPERIQISQQMLRAIAYLHECEPQIIHRDLKPENILLDSALTVRLADFGLARDVQYVQESTSSVWIGTTRFMAPELFNRNRTSHIGTSSDIWSLGWILIELFSNKRPWAYISSQKVSNVYYEIFKRKPIPIPENIPLPVSKIIAECCDYEPTKRPSAKQILEALELVSCQMGSWANGVLRWYPDEQEKRDGEVVWDFNSDRPLHQLLRLKSAWRGWLARKLVLSGGLINGVSLVPIQDSRDWVEAISFEFGGSYTGQMLNGKRDGLGVMAFADGRVYTGFWQENVRKSVGRLIYADGDTAEGDWENDQLSGRGSYKSVQGATYDGGWLNDKQHGIGTEVWPDGTTYTGQFEQGSKTGQGLLSFADGSTYKGEVVKNILNGQGTYSWVDGRIYTGNWKDGRMQGRGVMSWPTGKKYNGEFHNDKRQGQGESSRPDGRTYKGGWFSGRQHGDGTHTDASGMVTQGNWQNGKLVEIREQVGTEQ